MKRWVSGPSDTPSRASSIRHGAARAVDPRPAVGGDDAPTIEALSAFGINAGRRSAFLKILVGKGQAALRRLPDDRGPTYAALVCDILERAHWGAVALVPRERNPESAEFRRSTGEALARYRERLDR